MGLFDRLKGLFAGGKATTDDASLERGRVLYIYARCKRCGEVIRARIDTFNELSPGNGGFVWRKELIGSGKNRCFQRIEVALDFDDRKQLAEQRIDHGDFVTAADYDAWLAAKDQEDQEPPADAPPAA